MLRLKLLFLIFFRNILHLRNNALKRQWSTQWTAPMIFILSSRLMSDYCVHNTLTCSPIDACISVSRSSHKIAERTAFLAFRSDHMMQFVVWHVTFRGPSPTSVSGEVAGTGRRNVSVPAFPHSRLKRCTFFQSMIRSLRRKFEFLGQPLSHRT
jgi:hypothetical protein